jgi:hypothetical protein
LAGAQGVNVHYANDFDETVLLAQQAPDHVGAVLVPSKRAIAWLPPILKSLRLSPAAVVPAGRSHAMGVQFEGVDSETRATLLRFLAEKLQRLRL